MLVVESRKQILWLVVSLNVVALAFYFFIAAFYGFFSNVPVSMFAASDTATYLNVADWLAGRTDDPHSLRGRPFLYPLLLALIRGVSSSPYAIWFVQFVFWLLAVNLTALSAYRLTGARWILTVVFLLASWNLTLLGLTFYGLSETTAFVLLAGWLLLWSGQQRRQDCRDDFWLVLLLSSLTVVKPVFQGPLLVYVLFCGWRRRRNVRGLGLLLAACAPVITQLALVYALFGAVTISNVPAYNLRHYFFAQVYAANTGRALQDEAGYNAIQPEVRQFSEQEIYQFLLRHPLSAGQYYVQNIKEGFFAGAVTMHERPTLYALTESTNRLYFMLHLAFGGLVLWSLWRRRAFVWRVFFPLLFSYWIFFSAGTAYWQGDRLIVTALPLWLVAYAGLTQAVRDGSSALPHAD